MVLTGNKNFLQTINAAYQCLLLLRSGIVLLFYLCVRMHFESVNCDIEAIDTRFAIFEAFPGQTFELKDLEIQNTVANASIDLAEDEYLDLERFYNDFSRFEYVNILS